MGAKLGLSVFVASLALADTGTAQQPEFFDAPVVAVKDWQQRMNALLDLNGDGWTDAVGTFWPDDDTGAVFAFLNDGTGVLQPLFEDTWSQNGDNDMPFPIVTGEFTGDGLDDFALGLRDEMRLYQSSGSIAPGLLHDVYLGSGNEAQDLAIGDYDGDGSLEIAVRLMKPSSGDDRGIAIYDDLLTNPQQVAFLQPGLGSGYILKNMEVNGDGVIDLVLIGPRIKLLTMAGGSLVEVASYNSGMGGNNNGAADDIDGDGDEDLVVFEMSGQYRVLRREGPTSFVFEPVQAGGPATGLADVDGDGDPDGVCCGGGGGGTTTFYNNSSSRFEIAINDGTGAFQSSFQLPALGSNEIAGVDDIDKDGDADLIAGRVVYYNRGSLAPMSPLTSAPIDADDVADLDGDGDPDVQTSHESFERNSADGAFSVLARISPLAPAGSTFEAPFVRGDFDGDGDVDIIALELQGGAPTNERLLLNTGGGGLVDGGAVTAPGVTFSGSPDFRDTWTGDLNGDGLLDVLAVDTSSVLTGIMTRIYLQALDGSFSLTTTLTGETVALVADLDEDGMDDLMTVDRTYFYMRFGDSAGSLSTVQNFLQVPGNYYYQDRFAAGDLDGNGTLDVVATRLEAGTSYDSLRILLNQGSRQFQMLNSVLPGVHMGTARFNLADVDLDGELDLLLDSRYDAAAGNWVPGTSIFLGKPGIAAFDPEGEDLYPALSALADLDGDGDVDGVGASSATYEVIENRVHGPQEGGARLQFGTATPGLGGQEPVLGAVGPFAAGNTIQIRVTGAAPGAQGKLFFGTAGSTWMPALGATLEVTPILEIPFQAASATGEWGSGAFYKDVQVPPNAAGKTFYLQALLFDAAGQGGGTATNALQLDFAP